MNDLTVLTERDIRENVNLIQRVMRTVMKRDIHYGIIPGCQKPSLFKPGAEKIASTFRIAVTSEVEDLSTTDEKRYRVTCTAHSVSGNKLGSSIGECSSSEEKYRWRRPICDKEWEAAEGDRKREKWQKDGTTIKQMRTEPADLANTILQMADKRAYVAVVRKVTAASDVFTQDIEDLPEEVRGDIATQQTTPAGKPEVQPPKEKEMAYSDIITLQQGKVGDVLNVQGYLISMTASTTKAPSSYIVGDLPKEPTTQITIKAFGEVLKAVAGQLVKFNTVKVAEYNGKKQATASEVVCG